MKRLFSMVVTAMLATGGIAVTTVAAEAAACTRTTATIGVPLDAEDHRDILRHARDAIAKGYPAVLVLNRPGADERRRKALTTIPTKRGYDRDEYPPAIGRAVVAADVRHVPSAENRSAGALMGSTLQRYCDGTKFAYSVRSTAVPTLAPTAGTDPRFRTCAEAKRKGYGPYVRGTDPEYRWYTDRDGDGTVCE
ncbi:MULTISPECIES: excalibur calcium-binding domain-containing protein [Actinoplanes]|uniref:excalibur calcium-binding domain-containing protein n=1 Tax=Actinoplanes TaxID=1865 RepID=UPI000695D153|nr:MULTISPECIES: excalibur calcium-binding domain-containing protein [Actinoplanes]GLY04517.1 hypothetical protein Acsp01_48960 [Actinoplanes sp. NBRC 101535]